ncbi:hypothetical protein NMY22_g4008 [Coprinellus aureogranulatus]|nr:hypothetical protein NMY22_g4008 [Coprinellus aureogranulatus]
MVTWNPRPREFEYPAIEGPYEHGFSTVSCHAYLSPHLKSCQYSGAKFPDTTETMQATPYDPYNLEPGVQIDTERFYATLTAEGREFHRTYISYVNRRDVYERIEWESQQDQAVLHLHMMAYMTALNEAMRDRDIDFPLSSVESRVREA